MTLPLYRKDDKNGTSFHHYIDYKKQIVLIATMPNGQIIAGYSEPAIKPKAKVEYETGLIFGFKNRKVFTVKREKTSKSNKTVPKPYTWDEYWIIWGNADIRIRSGGSSELFSNYATANSSYEEKDNPNPSIVDLFMQSEREAIVMDYEFHQIQFEGQSP